MFLLALVSVPRYKVSGWIGVALYHPTRRWHVSNRLKTMLYFSHNIWLTVINIGLVVDIRLTSLWIISCAFSNLCVRFYHFTKTKERRNLMNGMKKLFVAALVVLGYRMLQVGNTSKNNSSRQILKINVVTTNSIIYDMTKISPVI